MRQFLVIFCSSVQEALTTAAALPPYKDLPRFYVLNCEKPSSDNLNWLRPVDDYICLGKVTELGNHTEISIRSAILYIPNWWHLLFCNANDLPPIEEVNEARRQIDSNVGFVQMPKIWGISKEHLLLFGLGKIFGSGTIKNEAETLESELDIVRALRGEPVNIEAVKKAFVEVVSTNGMIFQGAMPLMGKEEKEFIDYMVKTFNVVPENPGVIFISPNTSNKGFEMLLDQISSQTMIAVVDKEDKAYEKEPYMKFNCDNEFFVKVYTKGGF